MERPVLSVGLSVCLLMVPLTRTNAEDVRRVSKSELARLVELPDTYYDGEIREDPLNPQLYQLRGLMRNEKRQFDKAIADYNEAIRLDPKFALAFHSRGNVKIKLGKLGEAIADYDEAIRLDPQMAMAYSCRSCAYSDKGDPQRGLADANVAIRLDPTAPGYFYNRGNALRDLGELDKALKDYDEAIRLDGGVSGRYFEACGIVWYSKSEWGKAIAAFDEALVRDAEQPDTLFNRGTAWLQMNELDKAIHDLNDVLLLTPHHEGARVNRSVVWNRKGEFDKAAADLKEAIRHNPKSHEAYNNLAWMRATSPDMKMCDGQAAVELAHKASELVNWKDDSYLVTLAAAHARAGQFDDAKKRLQQAINMAPKADSRIRAKMMDVFKDGQPYQEDPAFK